MLGPNYQVLGTQKIKKNLTLGWNWEIKMIAYYQWEKINSCNNNISDIENEFQFQFKSRSLIYQAFWQTLSLAGSIYIWINLMMNFII